MITRLLNQSLVASLLVWNAAVSVVANETLDVVPLAHVRLLPGEFKERQDLHRQVILSYDVDRLLHNFRVNAGLPSSAMPYGGWESPGVGLRGHFTGHNLSACALMYGATQDAQFKECADKLVAELGKCQAALGTNAMPASDTTTSPSGFSKLPVPPVPTLHSIMSSGLTRVTNQASHFTVPVAGETNLSVMPFYKLHHKRYTIYWQAL